MSFPAKLKSLFFALVTLNAFVLPNELLTVFLSERELVVSFCVLDAERQSAVSRAPLPEGFFLQGEEPDWVDPTSLPPSCEGQYATLYASGWASLANASQKIDSMQRELSQRSIGASLSSYAFGNADPSRSIGLWAGLVLVVLTLGVVTIVNRRSAPSPGRESIGLKNAIGLGILCGIAVLAIAVLIALALNAAGLNPKPIRVPPLSFGLVFSLLVVAPVVEEVAFRWWLQERVYAIFGGAASVYLGTVLFVAVHRPTDAFALVSIAAASLGFSLLWHYTRSLTAVIVAHLIRNLAVVGAILYAG